MSVLKDLRFVALCVIVVAAVAIIASPYYIKYKEVRIDTVFPDSLCGFSEEDLVSEVNSVTIKGAEDFEHAVGQIKKGERATMLIAGRPAGCVASADGSLGFSVYQTQLSVLRFGIDVEGGTRVLLSPTEEATKEELTETIKTLENRINFYGLKEVKVNSLGNNLIQIEMSGATGDDVREFLARQGEFKGKLSESVRFVDGTGKLKIGNKTHDIEREADGIVLNGKKYSANETFVLENETFEVMSVTNSSALLYARLFTGKDIVSVLSGTQNSGIRSVGDGFYEFSFSIQVSRDGAKRFGKLTAGQPVVRTVGSDRYIEPKLLLFLDDRLITDLNIGASIAGQEVTSATITGTESGLDEAGREKLRLESTLRSGSLPVKVEIAKVDTITQTAGKDLINSTIFVAIASVIAVSAIVAYRYRDYKIVLPMVLISLSEVAIVVGMAASQVFAGFVIAVAILIGLWKREVFGIIGWVTLIVMIGAAATVILSPWTIDIPVIAGLIAILGTGVNQMIIMTDQLLLEKGKTIQERHKSAMHMIWSSAAIVLFAMIPLILGGIGSLKGFAIATIVGVLVGILVTRPAYVAIIEKVKKVKLESI